MVRAIAASTLALFVVSSGVALGDRGDVDAGFDADASRVQPFAGAHGEVRVRPRGMLVRTDGGFLIRHRGRP